MRPIGLLCASVLTLLLATAAPTSWAQEAADPHHPPEAAAPAAPAEAAPTAPDAGAAAGGMPMLPPGRGMGMMGMMGERGPHGMMGMMGERGPGGMMRMDDGPTDPVAAAFAAINRRMHRDMAVPPSGSADRDFANAMIAHHQGAIDMAKVVLGFGKDAEIRKLAEEVIAAQEKEIATLRQWLARQPQ